MWGDLDREEAHRRHYNDMELMTSGKISIEEYTARLCLMQMGHFWEDLSEAEQKEALEVIRQVYFEAHERYVESGVIGQARIDQLKAKGYTVRYGYNYKPAFYPALNGSNIDGQPYDTEAAAWRRASEFDHALERKM